MTRGLVNRCRLKVINRPLKPGSKQLAKDHLWIYFFEGGKKLTNKARLLGWLGLTGSRKKGEIPEKDRAGGVARRPLGSPLGWDAPGQWASCGLRVRALVPLGPHTPGGCVWCQATRHRSEPCLLPDTSPRRSNLIFLALVFPLQRWGGTPCSSQGLVLS